MNSTGEIHNCRNCKQEFIGNFCSNCGEKAYHRLKVKYLISNAFQYVFNLERGFLFTFWELTIRPGRVIQDYIKGKRKVYHPPFSYLVLSIALISLSTLLVTTAEQTEMILNSRPEAGDGKFYFTPDQIGEYVKYFLFGIIPFIATYSYWFFKKSKYNFAEHLVLNTYVMAQINFINVLSVVTIYMLQSKSIILIDSIFTFLQMAYLAWSFNRFFRNGFLGVLKSIFAFIFAILTLILIVGGSFILFKITTGRLINTILLQHF